MRDVFFVVVVVFFFVIFFYFSDDESNPFERPIKKKQQPKMRKSTVPSVSCFHQFPRV